MGNFEDNFCPDCHSLMIMGECTKCRNSAKKGQNRKVPNTRHKSKSRKSKSNLTRLPKKESSRKKAENAWKLEMNLFKWQKEAVDSWCDNNYSGIVKVITGAGKTVLALKLISLITNEGQNKNIKIFIIVPTRALIDQWGKEIFQKLNLDSKYVAKLRGKESINESLANFTIFLSTINTAREYLPLLNDSFKELDYKTFIIADECHKCGSDKNSNVFSTKSGYDYKLGLSATPERQVDWGFREKLIPNLGDIIYEYNYQRALDDGVIPPFQVINCRVDFTANEKHEYDDLSDKISRLHEELVDKYYDLKYAVGDDFFKVLNSLHKSTNDETIKLYKKLIYSRRILAKSAENRYSKLMEILANVTSNSQKPKILIFHEMIECADNLHKLLTASNYDSKVYHSKIPDDSRKKALNDYKESSLDILVACKALDEGLDVPHTNVGIIVASSKSVRQFIQRIGRILRKSDDNTVNKIFYIYIPEIDENFESLDLDCIEQIEVIDFDDYIHKKSVNKCENCLYYGDCVQYFSYCVFDGKKIVKNENDYYNISKIALKYGIIKIINELYDRSRTNLRDCDKCIYKADCDLEFIYCPYQYCKKS